jgi:hypothetical protein
MRIGLTIKPTFTLHCRVLLQTVMTRYMHFSARIQLSTVRIMDVDVSQASMATQVKRMLTSDIVVHATMSAPPGPYKWVEDLIFAGSQRYIGSPTGVFGLEFKLSQMSV